MAEVQLDALLARTGYSVKVSVTRPANATPYTAGDVFGGAFEIPLIGPVGATILIRSVEFEYDVAALPSGMTTCKLALFNVTPPSAIADNGVWTEIPSGDRAAWLGEVPLGTLVDRGATLYIESTGIDKQVKLVTSSLWAYNITAGGFTPAGNSEVFAVTLHAVAL